MKDGPSGNADDPNQRPGGSAEPWYGWVIESIRDHAIMLLDTEGRITRWTAGAEAVIGFTEAEAIGQNGAIIFTEADRASGLPELELAKAAATGVAIDERWHLRKDGSRFWASGTMNALRDDDGTVTGFIKILRDQTGQKELTDHLGRARRQAEAANSAKDQFIATVSHELRTPISVILMWTRLLLREAGEDTQLRAALAAIERNAAAQSRLIEDLLDTSRMASGKFGLHLAPAPIADVVAQVVEALRPGMEARRIDCELDVEPGLGVFECDAERIAQVVCNLVSNAVKFTPDGGRVSVRVQRGASGVEIVVQDTGIGIDPDFLPRVFDRFTQADATASRVHLGLGLGLSIVKSIVELHGGTVHAESDPPGSRFTVVLPLRPAPDSAAVAPPQAPAPRGLEGRRVLLVEDRPDAAEVIAITLRRAGAQVAVAGTAREALGLLESERPEVVVSDLSMPDMDGFEFIRQVRLVEATLERLSVPALALTAFGDKETHARAVRSGFTAFLVKPSDPDALTVEIARLLESQQPRPPL